MNFFKKDKEKINIPRSVQQAIPIKSLYEDGVFQVGKNKYSKTFKFTDVNYAPAGQGDKEYMILGYGGILNLLDSASQPKLTIIKRKLNKIDFDNKIKLELGEDNLTKHRKEMNDIMARNSMESNNMIVEKLLTITIDKKNIDEARNYFTRVATELGNSFMKLNSKFTELEVNERIQLFYDFYRVGEEDLYNFNIRDCMRKGHSFKDYICPNTFEFKSDYFKMGERFGRVLYLKEYASFIRDSIISEFTDLDKNMILSIDIKPVPMEEAIRKAEQIRLGVETNITGWQKRQNANNNFSAVIPYDLERQREESKEFLDDLMTRDQRMFLSTLTIVHTADSKEELDNDTESLLTIAGKYLCQLSVLKYQQIDGLNTVLPARSKKNKCKKNINNRELECIYAF